MGVVGYNVVAGQRAVANMALARLGWEKQKIDSQDAYTNCDQLS